MYSNYEIMYSLLNSKFNTCPSFLLSKDFHPAFSRIAEIRAIVPSGTPLMDCTATETCSIQKCVNFEMSEVGQVNSKPF